jgi:hypothetical protein
MKNTLAYYDKESKNDERAESFQVPTLSENTQSWCRRSARGLRNDKSLDPEFKCSIALCF